MPRAQANGALETIIEVAYPVRRAMPASRILTEIGTSPPSFAIVDPAQTRGSAGLYPCLAVCTN